MTRSPRQLTIDTDIKWLSTLGRVEQLAGERRYRLVFANGSIAFAKFHDLKSLTILTNDKDKRKPTARTFSYMPMTDTAAVAVFLLASVLGITDLAARARIATARQRLSDSDGPYAVADAL